MYGSQDRKSQNENSMLADELKNPSKQRNDSSSVSLQISPIIKMN